MIRTIFTGMGFVSGCERFVNVYIKPDVGAAYGTPWKTREQADRIAEQTKINGEPSPVYRIHVIPKPPIDPLPVAG